MPDIDFRSPDGHGLRAEPDGHGHYDILDECCRVVTTAQEIGDVMRITREGKAMDEALQVWPLLRDELAANGVK